MYCLSLIAEQRISQAIEKGELKTTGWENKPLPLDDDHLVPEDLKIAYKMLKNAGYVPPEIETRKEINRLEQLIARTEDEHERVQQMRKLSVLMMKVEANRNSPSNISHNDDYYRRIVEKTSVNSIAPKKKS